MSKSTVPVDTGVPNPFYQKAMEFLNASEEVRQIAKQIRAIGKEHRRDRPGRSAVDIAAVLRACRESGLEARMRVIFDKTAGAPVTPNTMGPPPPSKQLYGRFGRGLSILDVGSGNKVKLRRYTGSLKITCVDPVLDCSESHVFSALFKLDIASFLREHPQDDPIITSFMSLCQLPPVEQSMLFDFDGLHVVPDHDVLYKNKVAITTEDGLYHVRTIKQDYFDYPVPSGGLEIEAGYKLLPVFRRREISFETPDQHADLKPIHLNCSPASMLDMNFRDVGYKFDGVPVQLSGGTCGTLYLVDRKGRARKGLHDLGFFFSLQFEYMVHYYVLIRVVHWRGVVFPHCGYTLRSFANRVKMKINGLPVYGPPVWEPGVDCQLTSEHFPPVLEKGIDGIISRRDERDYYCKPNWTVDFRPSDFEKFYELIIHAGYTYVEVEPHPGLCEYRLIKSEGEISFLYLRSRDDKNTSTSMDTARMFLDIVDFGEGEALTGSPAILY